MPGKTSIAAVVFLVALCSLTLVRAADTILSLDQAVEIALENNPRIESARQQLLAGEAVLDQSRSRFLPRLSTGANLSALHIDQLQPEDQDAVIQLLLRAEQLIWDFGRTTGLIDAASLSMQAAAENLRQVRQDIVFEVKQAFYTVLRAEQLVEVALQSVENYQQQLYRAQKYYDSGIRAKIDITNAEVNLAGQRLALLRSRADLKASRVAFETVLGTTPGDGSYQLSPGDLPLSGSTRTRPAIPGTLEELLREGLQLRPLLSRYRLLIHSAAALVRQAEGDFWPAISATGQYQEYQTDLSALNDQWQLGVGLSWEFFSGFESEARVAEAKAGLREIEAILRELELQVTESITDSYLRAEENREGIDIAAQSLELAAENLRLADGRYQAGIGDILEYNDAQLLFTRNQTDLVNSYYAYLTDLARLEQAVGTVSFEPARDDLLQHGYRTPPRKAPAP